MNEFIEQFLIESRELVEQTADDLLALEQSPDDRARLDSAFRGFHTLKGGAGIVDFDAMARAVHAAEDFLAAVRAGDYPISMDLISHCLACLDQIGRWLDAMAVDGEIPPGADADADRVVTTFATFAGAPVDAGAAVPSDDRPAWIDALLARHTNAASATVAIRYTPASDCFFRGEDPLALVADLPGLLALDLQPREPWPALSEVDPFACNLIVDALAHGAHEDVARYFHAVRDQVQIYAVAARDVGGNASLPERAAGILAAQIALLSGPASDGFAGRLGSAGRVAANVLRHFGLPAKAQEVEDAVARGVEAGAADECLAVLQSIMQGDSAEAAAASEPAAPDAQAVVTHALRVDVKRIDALVKLTGELMVVKNALGHAARLADEGRDPKGLALALRSQQSLLDRLTTELQQSVLAIRLVPLRQVFQRFPRLVRELAASLGKPARLMIDGEATEADKTVVEALFEPLLHVLRNAVDHGVEAPAQRAAAGKADTAIIRLRGHREGEHVIIEVIDDGRGIDPVQLRRVAVERDLGTAEAVAALSDDAVMDFIFAPGFSTAASVTGVSGRGVGMDAVRAGIERLGGRVTIRSGVGTGSTIRFVLPLTVMMTRVMTVEAGAQIFGVPFEAVVETLQLERSLIASVGAANVFVLRDRTIPLINLAQVLDIDREDGAPAIAKIVVIEAGGQLGALEVDRFGERLDVMLKPMEGLLAGTAGIAGTTMMGDGRVLIVLDLPELLQ